MLLMIFTILGLCLYILGGIFFEIYFDRKIMYLGVNRHYYNDIEILDFLEVPARPAQMHDFVL